VATRVSEKTLNRLLIAATILLVIVVVAFVLEVQIILVVIRAVLETFLGPCNANQN
jgi:hypothetical protein